VTAKLSFRKWLDLESQKKNLVEAVEKGEFPDRMFAFLSTASVPFKENDVWQNTVFSFAEALKIQPDKKIPLLNDSPKDGKPVDWDYDGRSWPYWSHLISKAYGWTLEYIGELDVNEALARVQEILTDDHLDREFVYSLSEIAYPYNKSTKKNHFKPMPRPYWMKPAVQQMKTERFRKDMLPVGMIQDVSGMPDSMNPLRDYVQKKTKEANPPSSPQSLPPAETRPPQAG
jgi:hypothetical protein